MDWGEYIMQSRYDSPYGNNPCRDILGTRRTAIVHGWWDKQQSRYGEKLYHVIKLVERNKWSISAEDHDALESCWEILKVLNEMEGRK